MRLLIAVVLLSGLAAHAGDELAPDQMAKIEHDQKKAAEAVDKKHGNKKPSELSQDERREIIREKAEADQAVLDKAGVDKKDFARAGARMGRDQRAQADAAGKALEKKDAEAANAKQGGQKEIVVEHGLPPDEGVNEAAEADKEMGLGHETLSPKKSAKKKHR